MKNPKWTRDELLLTLDFYLKNFPRIPERNSDLISYLSKTLRKVQKTLNNKIDSSYRNHQWSSHEINELPTHKPRLLRQRS